MLTTFQKNNGAPLLGWPKSIYYFIIFIVVSYYCAYILDFALTYCCKLLRKSPFGSINKVINSLEAFLVQNTVKWISL